MALNGGSGKTKSAKAKKNITAKRSLSAEIPTIIFETDGIGGSGG
jgi:hypothetical protein